MTTPTALPGRRFWLAALILTLVLAADDGASRWYRMQAISALDTYGYGQPTIDEHSPTGYESGQRRLILPVSSLEGYHRIMQTQQMFAEGNLRVRRVAYDNAPHGREMPGSSLLRWWLGLLAWGHHFATGTPVAISVEQMAPLANPLLHAILLAGIVPLAARRFGALPAALLAMGMLSVYPIFEAFQLSGPDPHGLALACSLIMLFCLLAGGTGWVRADPAPGDDALAAWLPDIHEARRWFAASAVAGAVGLWISAATLIPVLATTAAGALLGTGWLARYPSSKAWHTESGLWSWWGRVGGTVSLACYLIDHFPGHLGLRLEVIHPLHALAWLGGGELIRRGCLWWSGTERPWHSPADSALAGISLLAALSPALFILAARDRVLTLMDRAMATVPTRELLSMRQTQEHLTLFETLVGMSPLPLIGVAMAVAWWRWKLPAPAKALLVLPLAGGGVTLALAIHHVRWLGITCSLWLVALVAFTFVASLPRRGPAGSRMGRAAAVIFLAAVLLPHPVHIVKSGINARREEVVLSPMDSQQVAHRDLAGWLRSRTGDTSAVVLAGPALTTGLIYHGGLQGIGTLSRENREGLRTAMEIFGGGLASARERLQRHGITHIVLTSWERFPVQAPEWLRLISGQRGPTVPFINTLADPTRAPAWLRPVFMPLTDDVFLQDEGVLIYEVLTSDPQPAAALVDRARYFVDVGRPQDALPMLRNVLNQEARNLPALVLLAHIQIGFRDAEGFAATITRLQGLVIGATDLHPADRIGLALVLTIAGEDQAAAREIATTLATLDEAGLRRLSPMALADLIGLSREYGLAESHPVTLAKAMALVPPTFRARLGLIPAEEAAR